MASGKFFASRGLIDNARTAVTQANTAAQAAGDFTSQVKALDTLGDLALLGTPDAKSAENFYNQALTAASNSGDPLLPIQPLTSLGDLQVSRHAKRRASDVLSSVVCRVTGR